MDKVGYNMHTTNMKENVQNTIVRAQLLLYKSKQNYVLHDDQNMNKRRELQTMPSDEKMNSKRRNENRRAWAILSLTMRRQVLVSDNA